MFTVSVQRKKTGVLDRVQRAIFGPKKVKVGFPAGEADSDVIHHAVWNEFGTKGSGKGFNTPRGGGFGGPIPERPFLRNAMRDNQAKYRAQLRASASSLLSGKTHMRATLSKLGIQAQGDVQAEITSLTSPANSPVTIALKGSDKPLIDTGEMRGAVTWKVDE